MKFPDKLTIHNEPERYVSGEMTGRFEVISETQVELETIRATLANVAMMAMESELALDPEDARVLLDFLRLNSMQQSCFTASVGQGDRLARLIAWGSATVSPDIIPNQFTNQEKVKAEKMAYVDMTSQAVEVAHTLQIEADARRFRKALNDAPTDDFFGPEA